MLFNTLQFWVFFIVVFLVAAVLMQQKVTARLPKSVVTPLALAAAKSIVARCRQARVPLIIFEIPASPLLKRNIDAEILARFQRQMADLAEGTDAVFLSTHDLGLDLDQSYFREQSHLNKKGASELTRALLLRTVNRMARFLY
jgi:hypothetical protein